MGRKKNTKKSSYSGEAVTPGVLILLLFVGLFSILLMVVAIVRGAL